MKKICLFACFLIPLFCLLISSPSFGQGRLSSLLQGFSLQNPPSDAQLQQLGASPADIQSLHDYLNKKTAQQNNQAQPVDTTQNKILLFDTTKTVTPAPSIPQGLQNIDTTKHFPASNIFGHNFFTNKNITLFNSATDVRAPENYVLAAGDQIAVSVWGFVDYNQMFTIAKDGSIQSKDFGRLYLKGLKLADAKTLLTQKLSSFLDLKNSHVDITVVYSRVITVNIVGEVFSPGSYSIPATNTAFNALIAANGPNLLGSVRKIQIKRDGKIIHTLDVYKFLLEPKENEDFFLENNDYIIVPSAEKIVSIKGEVKRGLYDNTQGIPYRFELSENEDLRSAINYAGGLTPQAYTKDIQIVSYKDSAVLRSINLDSILKANKPYPLLNGDAVFIDAIPSLAQNTVNINGAIKVEGQYEFREGERISDLIARAGGLLNEAFRQRGYILREDADLYRQVIPFSPEEMEKNNGSAQNLLLRKHDNVVLFSKGRFLDNDSILVNGSVRLPGYFAFGRGFTLKDALYFAGGLTREAAENHIEVARVSQYNKAKKDSLSRIIVLNTTVNYDLTIDKAAENFQLQPFDQVFVRKVAEFSYQENVTISGEVKYPGTYTLLNKKERLTDLIKQAGGLTDWAYPQGIAVSRQQNNIGPLSMNYDEILKNSNSPFNIIMQAGDQITIPRINEVVQIQGPVEYLRIANSNANTINAPYTGSKRARYYIRHFGLGFSKNALPGKTYVLQPGGFVDFTRDYVLFRRYPKVKPGATIKVVNNPEAAPVNQPSAPVDWNAFIDKTTVKITGLVTLWLLINTVIKK